MTLPQNTTIYEGGATILPCGTRGQRVQYGENFLWLRNSATIEHVVIDRNKAIGQAILRRAPQAANQRSELRVLESGSLQIINAQLVDSGEYTCVLWIDGSSDSASAYLTVKALGSCPRVRVCVCVCLRACGGYVCDCRRGKFNLGNKTMKTVKAKSWLPTNSSR